MYAVGIRVAEAAVTVVSGTRAVTDWCGRYVRPWWDAVEVAADAPAAALVVAQVDRARYLELAAAVEELPHRVITYARTRMLVADDGGDGVISAVAPDQALAFRSEPSVGRLAIRGGEVTGVATAAARLARESVRAQLLRAGWTVLHASAVERAGEVVLVLGSKGAGKTTTALTLTLRGWGLLANDRVFVRPDPSGGVRVLPWPAAAALGLGLLDALGWWEPARRRVAAGESLHPTQDQRVTEALLDGRRTPLWDGARELKTQVFPDQFPDWFGVSMSTGGRAAAVLFPQVRPDASAAVTDSVRALEEGDFMTGATEDRYPDVFGLADGIDRAGHDGQRREVTARLAELPCHAVLLGHDPAANGDLLSTLV